MNNNVSVYMKKKTRKINRISILNFMQFTLHGQSIYFPHMSFFKQKITKAESKRARREVFTFNRSPSSRIHTAMAPRDKTTEDHSMTSKRQQ